MLNVNDPQLLLDGPVDRLIDFIHDFPVVFRDIILQVDDGQSAVFHAVFLHAFHLSVKRRISPEFRPAPEIFDRTECSASETGHPGTGHRW